MTAQENSELKRLEKEVSELQQEIRKRWPPGMKYPWPQELQKLQGRLWKLFEEIIKEKSKPETLPQVDKELTPSQERKKRRLNQC